MPSLPSPDLLDLGRYAISRDGRMQPAAGRPPLRFHFLWRGRPVHLRLAGGALEFLVELGGIPSSAEGRSRRQAVFARLEQMSGEMPPGWELRLDPAHRLWLQASAAPAAFLGLEGRRGRIAPGFAADLCLLDDALNVTATWIDGVAR